MPPEPGGDTNNDGTCDPGNASSTAACPQPGDWRSLNFLSTSASSAISHAIIRYGANYAFCGFPTGAVMVNDISIDINNTAFEKNRAYGLWLTNSASTAVSNTVFSGHSGIACATGMVLNFSTPTLDAVTFRNNDTGISGDGTSSVILGPGGVIFDPDNPNTTDDLPSTLIP